MNFAISSSQLQEVVVGPENRSATSKDKFMRVNLIGDFAGYTNIPSFEDSYLVIPKQEVLICRLYSSDELS